MKNIALRTDPRVKEVFNKYPDAVRHKMLALREIILETAGGIESIKDLEETLKWGEPSYLTKHGSTIRIDWKPRSPNQYAIYFKCTSRLVETFKLAFKDTFTYEGKRAIIFQMDDYIPKEALSSCIKAALTYHKVKHLPTLGI